MLTDINDITLIGLAIYFRSYNKSLCVTRGLGVVDGWAVSAAACHAGGPGLIPGSGQTYV
jgi:hypothetical protein